MSASRTAELARRGRLRKAERLLVVLGDQLDHAMPELDRLDDERDAVLMLEVREEAEHVPSHRQRSTLFLAAMRHFALELLDKGRRLRYVRLDERGNTQSLGSEVERAVRSLGARRLVVTRPGEHRVEALLREACGAAGVELEVVPDRSFTCSPDEFEAWAAGRKILVMEHFYRERRRRLDLLMTRSGKPRGGEWNYDARNRASFKQPPDVKKPYRPVPDEVTRDVMQLVERTWPDAPGRMEQFRWPVTRREARRALADFVEHRLDNFGTFQDAMWEGEAFLYHSLLSSSLNLKLLRPLECVEPALQALEAGRAPINDVEGFVRQIIGWREFIRGVYYHEGTDYASRNGLGHQGRLPALFWTGETRMNCLRHCVGEVLDNAYGHHIARLMVIGNFALIAGIDAREVEAWFLAMYVDAVEWVTAPNVIGMSQHADGGVVGTKPYAASGKYVDRMSNYCADCPYDVRKRTGEDACPFNTFYWDFLARHRKRFAGNRRMAMMLKNVDRMDRGERREIAARARRLRAELGIE